MELLLFSEVIWQKIIWRLYLFPSQKDRFFIYANLFVWMSGSVLDAKVYFVVFLFSQGLSHEIDKVTNILQNWKLRLHADLCLFTNKNGEHFVIDLFWEVGNNSQDDEISHPMLYFIIKVFLTLGSKSVLWSRVKHLWI